MAEHFEYAIIGGGKGGKTLAGDLASHGHQTVMVERGMIGGTCINVGCIPTKTLVRGAKAADLARHAADFGIRADFHGVDPIALRNHKRSVVAGMVKINRTKFEQSGMTLLIGSARFTGPRTVEVKLDNGEVRTLSAERVFINTGTRPSSPPLPGLAEAQPLTNESLLELDRVPEHLLVLGAGYIGVEFAQMYRRFGSRVTMIDRGARFLPREDADVAEQVLAILKEEGVEVLQSAEPLRVAGRSGQSVQLEIRTPSGQRTIEGSDLLAAMGRSPNTEELNLSAAGVQTDSRGFVKVNERLETSAANVWALGDVNGGPQFTHISLDDYRIVKANLAGGHRSTRDRLVPYTLFIDPELGRVGLTEEQARAQGRPIKVARLPAAAVARARTMNEMRGLLKAVVDASTDRILGAAILAPEGGEVMSVIQIAMQAGLPYTALRDSIYAHPTMSEGLNDLFARVE
ncbi:MAG: mercuric reductase [Planctomycetia bacterium]|nr:mercuric reductase [Planctomycetia bacterium]